MQYSYFSVISGCLHKTVQLFGKYLAPHPIQCWKSGKFWIYASNVVCGMEGGLLLGHVWSEKSATNEKFSPDMSTIAGEDHTHLISDLWPGSVTEDTQDESTGLRVTEWNWMELFWSDNSTCVKTRKITKWWTALACFIFYHSNRHLQLSMT